MRKDFLRRVMFIQLALLSGGCVERTLTITSSPPGALCYLNGEEVGRTPVTRDFLWYGNYEVALRKDGYAALKTTQNVKPPYYQIIPLDLFAELFDVKDAQQFNFNLTPARSPDPQALIERAEQLKSQLQSSQSPTTRPSSLKPIGPSRQ
jgi:hypothetical protein